jgi:hypothetical protein
MWKAMLSALLFLSLSLPRPLIQTLTHIHTGPLEVEGKKEAAASGAHLTCKSGCKQGCSLSLL